MNPILNDRDTPISTQPIVVPASSGPVSYNSSTKLATTLKSLNKKSVIVLAVSLITISGFALSIYQSKSDSQGKKSPTKRASTNNPVKINSIASPATEETPTPEPTPTPTPTPAKTGNTVKPATPAVATVPTPVVNTTNCLPANPSPYAIYYIGMTNSGYLQTNSYGETNTMYAALQFAGLLSSVNAKQVVVFAPNDYVFNTKLTASQLAWMNASPENMRSVLGWHIITGCVTYDGLNPIKGKTGTMTLTTLNGPVTLTMGGKGLIENASVAIWDWFTSNGSVTFITDFIKPPSVQ